jgi:hypothetical protein
MAIKSLDKTCWTLLMVTMSVGFRGGLSVAGATRVVLDATRVC